MAPDSYRLLIEKLDGFIRKYYQNQLIRGAIYAFTLSLGFFLLVTLLESIGHFSIGLRTFLFWAFILGITFLLVRFVAIPLAHLYRIGRIISHEEAARIIGKHFSHVQDKLLNVLQLRELAGSAGDNALIEASISQKVDELRPVPFVAAVNLRENRRHLRYAALPLAVLLVLLFAAPSLITDSTKRLIEHRTYFEKPAPFKFVVENQSLRAIQQEDFRLDVRIEGKEIPAEASIELDGKLFRLEKETATKFHYNFRNLQQPQEFRLTADGFYSSTYQLEAVPKPTLMNFQVRLEYPAYLNKKTETLENNGDLVIPAGTRVTWTFNTRNTDVFRLAFGDTLLALQPEGEERFSLSRRFLRNDSYALLPSNRFLGSPDTVKYGITVVPDQYPTITMEEQQDSLSPKRTFFRGLVRDDYGFSALSFHFHFLKSNDTTGTNRNRSFSENLPVNRSLTTDAFYYSWDLSSVNIQAGDEVEYYFEVRDNDGVSGAKAARTPVRVFKAPSLREIAENSEKSNQSIKSDLTESIRKARQLQKDVSDLNKKLLEKKEASWEDRKKAEELLKREQELRKQLEEVSKQNQEKNRQEQEYKRVNEDILAKQEQLQSLLDKLMSPELEKMMQQLQELMQQLDKNQLQEQLSQMKTDNKDLQKELERTLELFKQMEFEQKLQESIDKLKDLAKKQDDLSKQADDKNADSRDLQAKQDELNKEFEDFRKDMDELAKKNDALEEKQNLENTDQQEQEIQQEMQNSSQQLNQGKNNKAGKSQKNAAQKMDQLAQKLEKNQQQMEQEQAEEDMDALRALLENLLRMSFDQEKLMTDLKGMDINNPQYLRAGQEQRRLKDNARVIEDSLFALSKRVMQIQAKVNQEIAAINLNMGEAIDNLEERNVPQARSRQQFVMTSVNNLTLLLSEALQQMQQQQANAQPSASCKKPGKKKSSSIAEMKKMQEELNKNMQKMKELLKQQGSKSQGKISKDQSMSEQLAKMAAQQEYIRQQLQQLNQEDNKDGRKSLGNLEDIANQMEQTEKDIVNRMISDQTLKRQEEIMTRLLESERAERERDQDEQRKSEEAKNRFERNPAAFEEYKRLKLKEMELLRTVPPSLSSFYRQKVSDYFQSIEK